MSAAVAAPASTPTPEPGKADIEAAAKGEKLTPEEEHGALHFLLGPRRRIEHSVTVQFSTPEGDRPLKFVVLQQDGRELDKIEQANISEQTGRADQVTANCQIVARATVRLEDADGTVTDLKSEEFRTVNPDNPPLASPADALEFRFRDQMGLIFGVATQVRRISGWDPEKVGTAQRVLVEPTPKLTAASGN